MPLRKWDLRIKDIVASIERIMEYTRALDFKNFKSDTKIIQGDLSPIVPKLKDLLRKQGV